MPFNDDTIDRVFFYHKMMPMKLLEMYVVNVDDFN